jgi:hypothetical protein
MMRYLIAAWLLVVIPLSLAGQAVAATPGSADTVVLDESAYWHRYYRFGVNRISLAALKAEGTQVLGPQGLDRAKKQTLKMMQDDGLDPAGKDWQAYAAPKMYLGRYTAPPPPDDWAAVGFDDRCWVWQRGTFQGDTPPDSTEFVDRGLISAFYRGRFVVNDPAKAGNLTLRVVYHGGARVFLNRTELARGHLPPGAVAADAAAQDYPLEAYQQPSPALCQRAVGPLTIPSRHLVKDVNVLAVEIHASRFHPIVMTYPVQHNWCDSQRSWPHACLVSLDLRTTAPEAFARSDRRPGIQVWAADPHERIKSSEFLPPGEAPGTARVIGARNGTYGAQLVIGTDRELRQLRVVPGALKQVGGAGEIAAANIRVFFAAPLPANEFTVEKLGSEKGLSGKFPNARQLAQFETTADTSQDCIFDHLVATAPQRIPADRCRPVWLSLAIPADAVSGTYRGTVDVSAEGMAPLCIPLEAEVLAWRLPAPRDFQTFVACEENPYGVAKHYGVPPWSERHFQLLDASFRQLGRVGNRWLNVPILRNTEFGNCDDSPVEWIRRKDGTMSFRFTNLDRYLDLAMKHWGRPPVLNLVVMHGTKSQPPVPAEVMVRDETTGQKQPLEVMASQPDKQQLWKEFAAALGKHLDGRGLKGMYCWGFPADGQEEDPDLMVVLAQALPEVFWIRGSHCLLPNYAPDRKYYRVINTARYWGGMPLFRLDLGWKSETLHLLNPRVDSTCIAIHTTSLPYAFRLTPELALARGRNGFGRIAADGWAGAHFDGMAPRIWITGLPVLFTLWPGRDGAEPGIRFEMTLEGIQETEARIFLEKALDRNLLPPQMTERVRSVLARRLRETNIFQPNITVPDLEAYHYRWPERSRAIYQAAAEVSELLKKDAL